MLQKKDKDRVSILPGSIEDQLDSALLKLAELESKTISLTNDNHRLIESVRAEELRNSALTDVLVTVLEVPMEMLELAFSNARVFSLRQGTPKEKWAARQAALRRKIEKIECESVGDDK